MGGWSPRVFARSFRARRCSDVSGAARGVLASGGSCVCGPPAGLSPAPAADGWSPRVFAPSFEGWAWVGWRRYGLYPPPPPSCGSWEYLRTAFENKGPASCRPFCISLRCARLHGGTPGSPVCPLLSSVPGDSSVSGVAGGASCFRGFCRREPPGGLSPPPAADRCVSEHGFSQRGPRCLHWIREH